MPHVDRTRSLFVLGPERIASPDMHFVFVRSYV